MNRPGNVQAEDARPYPLRLQPIYRDYLWGGDRIPRRFGRPEPPGIYAESWEAADRPDASNKVLNGPWSGTSLRELLAAEGPRILGRPEPSDAFPLLVKLIDARQDLSVQVHPDDATAARFGGEAKSEMWTVLDADPGAVVFAGLKPAVDRGAFLRALEEDRVADVLQSVPVLKGDCVWVPGGRVHAIGKGCLLLEIQQNSDTTYRLYDWGRVGSDGKPRPLHLDQALRVMTWDDREAVKLAPGEAEHTGSNRRQILAETPYFSLERFSVAEPLLLPAQPEGFRVLFLEEGTGRLEWPGNEHAMPHGSSWLLPAERDTVMVLPDKDAPMSLLQIAPGPQSP